MVNFISFGVGVYQYLPEKIDPIALHIGSFSLSWYSLMYLVGFLVVYLLLVYRLKKKEADYSRELIVDCLLFLIVGLLAGGRLGYVFFYNPSYFWHNPLAIISPLDAGGSYAGISGMSFYGGLLGILLAGIIFCKKHKLKFLEMADFIIPAIPAGYFFGRLGNFLNGELFGRITEKPWGMYFYDKILRHPAQLYEAFFEGLLVFSILWFLRNKARFTGQLLLSYLFLYGFFRFFIEFFRQPDSQSGLFFSTLTLGQIFSAILLLASGGIYFYNYNNKKIISPC